MTVVYLCPKCSAVSALAPRDAAVCLACGAAPPPETMPTIRLARDREMPRGIHAMVVIAGFISAFWMFAFVISAGEPIWAQLAGRPADAYEWSTIALMGFMVFVPLMTGLGLHAEQRWARPLAVAATLGWIYLAYSAEIVKVTYSVEGSVVGIRGRSDWLVALARMIPTFGAGAWVVWYFYIHRRTRDYYRALASIPRNPTITPTGAPPTPILTPPSAPQM